MARAAIRYAKAILDIANANGHAATVNEDMKTIITAVNESKELEDFLGNPVVKGDVKNAALSEIFASVQSETKGLFQLLLENKRFEILAEIATQYNALFDEMNGIEKVKVTTAFPITPELEAKVLAKIKEFSNKSVTIENIVDPEIIGGFVLRIGDKQYNASIATRLRELKRELSN
ncbi:MULTISPECIES: ATP synthase F1 subunit delta [Flavobacterium]|uniref:ATP synthase F1 subunit delta n=1 Tax=Flavobacterium TaxID=237 RepID=UPI000966D2CC|nr:MULTISPECIES: ATP synthase F1 subunit delta [Flavobacterium]MBN9285327.1 ATP synthase F1 subunit delta [Flavobacterium sp.]OJV71613.1 MAG: ATP synthase F1 subunit delta [Flavobacterium sp. 40-81]